MGQCDFCSSPKVVRHYACLDFDAESKDIGVTYSTRIGPEINLILASKSYWASCAECARLVDARDIDALVERALTELQHSYSPNVKAQLRKHLEWMYGLFLVNKLPEVGPWTKMK